jgi:hypothetical protein
MQRLRGHTRSWARSSRSTEAAVKKPFDGVTERLRAFVDSGLHQWADLAMFCQASLRRSYYPGRLARPNRPS